MEFANSSIFSYSVGKWQINNQISSHNCGFLQFPFHDCWLFHFKTWKWQVQPIRQQLDWLACCYMLAAVEPIRSRADALWLWDHTSFNESNQEKESLNVTAGNWGFPACSAPACTSMHHSECCGPIYSKHRGKEAVEEESRRSWMWQLPWLSVVAVQHMCSFFLILCSSGLFKYIDHLIIGVFLEGGRKGSAWVRVPTDQWANHRQGAAHSYYRHSGFKRGTCWVRISIS